MKTWYNDATTEERETAPQAPSMLSPLSPLGIIKLIDAPLLKRQRMALNQAIDDSPHPLRKELLLGISTLLDEICDCMERETGETRQFIDETDEESACVPQ